MINREKANEMLQVIDEKPVTTSFSISLALYVLLKAFAKIKDRPLSDFAVESLKEHLLKELESGDGIPEQLVADAVKNSAQVGEKIRVLEKFGLKNFVALDKEQHAERPQRRPAEKGPSMMFKQAFKSNYIEVTEEDMEPQDASFGKTTRKELVRMVKQLCDNTSKLEKKLSAMEESLIQMRNEKPQA